MIYVDTLKELPSYLQDVFPDLKMNAINLVYLKKTEDNDDIGPKNTNFVMNESQHDLTADITGSPLEVDLNGTESFVIEKTQCFQHWSEDENQHFPLSIQKARNYLNSKEINMRLIEPTFIVCDGENPLTTVILGIHEFGNQIFTCTVNILGCFLKDHTKVTLDTMERCHLLLTCTKQCKIDYTVTFKYFIYGTFLQNIINVNNVDHPGSICVETSVNEKSSLEQPCSIVDKVKVVLQMVVGHRKSLVHFLWNDLLLINKYVNILNSSHKDKQDVDICSDPLPIEIIYNEISNIVNTTLIKRELKVDFGLNNIRLPNIMDKLWDILIKCQDLRTLREAFHFFFEKLAESSSNIGMTEGSTSTMATIINGLLDGKLAVPTIDYSQSLEFLIELGAEKLKNDYQTILKYFYVSSAKVISSKWTELERKLAVKETHRKTRITHVAKDDRVVIKNCTSKLGYLAKLHVTTEFIYLVSTGAFLPEQTFDYFCEKVCKFYLIENCSLLEFQELLDNPLFNYDVVISNGDKDIVENTIPDFYSVRMKSIKDNVQTESVYVLSTYLIFPPNIYDDYDITREKGKTYYYAYKLESRIVPR